MNINKGLKTIRQKREIRQIKVAEGVGITQTYLSQIENGKRDPSLGVLRKLADYYEMPLSIIFWFCISEESVKKEKREIYQKLKPVIDNMIYEIF